MALFLRPTLQPTSQFHVTNTAYLYLKCENAIEPEEHGNCHQISRNKAAFPEQEIMIPLRDSISYERKGRFFTVDSLKCG